MKDSLVILMEKVAREYHSGQFRRDGVTPYITHVEDVVQRVSNCNDITIALAWGHDLLEDTTMTRASLIGMGAPKQFVEYLEMLTFPPGLTVDEYHLHVSRLAPYSVTRDVKLADNLSNISDAPSAKQILKYSGSIDILLSYALEGYSGKHKLCERK